MGWNGSGQKGAAPVQPKVTAKKPSPIRGIVAGGLVCVLAVGAYFAFFSGSEKPQAEKVEKERGRIKEVTPAAAPKYEELAPKPEKKEIPFWERATTNGLTPMEALKWKHHHTKIAFTNDITRYDKKPKYQVFDNGIDNRLACYLTIEPGQGLVGTPQFDEKFKERFLKSCEQPIIISQDDDDYTKELKKAVREVKVDLMNRIHDGEDIGQIFEETHAEILRLATLKRDIQSEFARYARENTGAPEDVEDYFKAANKMLEEKGIAPFKMSPVVKEAIRLAKEEATGKPVPDDDEDDPAPAAQNN